MIGLSFLAIGLLWLAFSVFVGHKLPRWLGIRNPVGKWAVTAAAVVVLLIGPFVDHIVGMRQFERLCDERTAPRIAADAASVELAQVSDSASRVLDGFFIDIQVSTVSYADPATGKALLEYEYFKTRGGRIAGLALMGGWNSCSAESKNSQYLSQLRALPVFRNNINGVQK
jgi:hypothetical protein